MYEAYNDSHNASDNIQYVDEPIYHDDCIENVKYKITKHLTDKNIHNYYFFFNYRPESKLNIKDIYRLFSDNKQSISFRNLEILLSNYNDWYKYIPSITAKYENASNTQSEISYKEFIDIVSYNTDDDIYFKQPLDVNLKLRTHVINPLMNDLQYMNKCDYDNAKTMIRYENMMDNTLYAIHYSVYYAYLETKNISMYAGDYAKIYYPKLFVHDIYELESLQVMSEENQDLKHKYEAYNELVVKHHQYNATIRQKPRFHIQTVDMMIKNKQAFNIPLEYLFKKLQTSKDIPLIKYNPGRQIENIYRLYSGEKDKNGRKIPYLPKYKITQLLDMMRRPKSVSMFVARHMKFENDTILLKMIIEIDEFGHLFCKLDDMKLKDKYVLDIIMKTSVNAIIYKLIQYFDPSNIVYELLESIKDESIEIIDLKYGIEIPKTKGDQIKKYIKYFQNIMDIHDDDNTIQLKYKRVSNYDNTLSTVENTVIELMNKQLRLEDMKQQIATKFNYSYEKSEEIIRNLINKIQVDDHMKNENDKMTKLIKIKQKNGMPIDIENDIKTRSLNLEIRLVDHVHYLSFLDIFVSNFVHFIQNKLSLKELDSFSPKRSVM